MKSKQLFLVVPALMFILILQGCSGGTEIKPTPLSSDQPTQPQTQIVKANTPFKFSQKVPAEGLADKVENLTKQLALNQNKTNHIFYLSPIVADKYYAFLGSLNDYYTKRYSDEEIKNTYLSQVKSLTDNGNITVMVIVGWAAGYNDTTSQLTFDDQSYQFFFLENEKGDYVKATSGTFNDYTRTVNVSGQSVILLVTFPQAEVENIMRDSKQLFFTFKGVKIMSNDKDNRVELQYPFTEYYKKDFPEVITMVQEMEDYGQ